MNLLVGISVASLIGTNLISRTTNVIVQQGIDTLSFFRFGSCYSEKMAVALRKIEELDIKIKIKILRKFLENKSYNKFPDLVEDMDTIIDKCCGIIETIEKIIQNHSTKWLKGYRCFDVSTELSELEFYNNVMKNRIEMLILETDM